MALWHRSLEAGVRAGRLIAEANPEFVARHLVICFYGVLVLWVQGNLDGEGFRAHVLYGFVLAMLGVASPAARAKLMKRLLELQRELPKQDGGPRGVAAGCVGYRRLNGRGIYPVTANLKVTPAGGPRH